MAIRAQPVRSVFQRMSRLVRELSVKTEKKVRLETVGEGTEVDKTVIDRLSDPLTHIIRNSMDHGIESPERRREIGKSEEGTITLLADQRSSRIVIEIRDDGAGIDPERVVKKAREKGLIPLEGHLTEDEINNLIFLPGFSTANAISDISGRGVGMDVVRRNVQDLGGRIVLKSTAGKGMTIQLSLPLTLAVMDGMIVKVATETYVMPIASIVECIRPAVSEFHSLLGTRGALRLRGAIVPIVYLGELFGLAAAAAECTDESTVIIIETSEGVRLGIVVDQLCGHQQVVIKSIEENYGAVPGIAGATILGDGHVAFILDAERLGEFAKYPEFTAARKDQYLQ
jgi:two-component system chemotaxis sensor kinase CheA